jgi:hypothetical protein
MAEGIQKEIDQISREMLPLQKRLESAREKLDLVRRLIHLSSPSAPEARPPAGAGEPKALPEIEDHIETLLSKAGVPVHIREIRERLIRAGVPLPGRGDEANIILRIRRAGLRFVRTERGTYGLASWNLPTYAPPPRKRRVRRRKAAAR